LKGDILWTKTVTGMTMIATGTIIKKTTTETGTMIKETGTMTIVRTGITKTTAINKTACALSLNTVQMNKKPQASYSPLVN
jgi:hypothetical protein